MNTRLLKVGVHPSKYLFLAAQRGQRILVRKGDHDKRSGQRYISLIREERKVAWKESERIKERKDATKHLIY